MKRLSILALTVLPLAGCGGDTPLVASASEAIEAAVADATAPALTGYEAIGGGRDFHFKLTNNGRGFWINHVATVGQPMVVETGTITRQTDLSGGNWLIEGMAGTKPITVFIERRGPLYCNDGYYGGDDEVRVVFGGYLYKGCGPYTQ